MKNQDDANLYIYERYISDHNRRFSVPAKNPIDAHRPLTDEMKKNLPSIFSVQSKRRVNNDYTIQFKTLWFQLEAQQKTSVYKRDEVIVEERLDGTIHIRITDVYLEYRVLPRRPKPIRIPIVALTTQKMRWVPPNNHPWRKKKL